uniref:uncharacterized protein LOC118152832 n=1 Tax=Callithrix jacchus TaxID=9483 RepID=UPI0004F0492C|nr:uncharacterized protein LOC118152832 [Callithrix jacchus]
MPRTQWAPCTFASGTIRLQYIVNSASTERLALGASSESNSSGTPPKPTSQGTPLYGIPAKCRTLSRSRPPHPQSVAPAANSVWSLKPRLLYKLRPSSDKTPPPGRQAPPSFCLCGVIQSSDWVCGSRPRLQTDRLLPFFRPKDRALG